MTEASPLPARVTVADCLSGEFLAVHEASLDRRADVGRPNAGATRGSVAVVDIMGPLSQRSEVDFFGAIDGYDGIEARFAEALRSDASAIVLRIDSPGGDAAGCFEAVRRMKAAAAAAGKPVVAFADEMAASAAYALATVADAGIVAPRSGLVGSVGVISMHATQARALVDAGVDVTVFRSGKRKAEGTMAEPLSDEAAVAMQGRVDALAQQFGALVAEARGTTPEAVLALEGAIFTAAEAVANGLADRIGTLDDAINLAAKTANTRKRDAMNEKQIRAALSLPESCDDEAVVAHVGALAVEHSALSASNGRILAALGASNVDEAEGVVEGLRALAAQAEESGKRAAELEAAQAKADVEAAIREGRDAGKITAATEGYWREKPAAEIRGFLKVAPVVIPGKSDAKEPAPVEAGGRWEDLSAAEKAAMQFAEPERFFALLNEFKARGGRSH